MLGVENRYFGGDVSVAGLLTGGDMLAAREHVRGDFLIIPGATLKSGEELMLDGVTLSELRNEMKLPVHALDFDSFAHLLTN